MTIFGDVGSKVNSFVGIMVLSVDDPVQISLMKNNNIVITLEAPDDEFIIT